MRKFNPYRTDHPTVELRKPTASCIEMGITKGIGSIYNDKTIGCCYDFNRDTETLQKSMQVFITYMKNISINKRLKRNYAR